MTPKRLAQLFRSTPDELRWVQERCKLSPARLGLLCLLKCFPVLGRLAAPEEIPTPVVEYLARCAGLDGLTLADYPRRTRVRHHIEVRAYLEIEPWGAAAQALATQTMERIVSGRAHLSDLINGAIEALVAANFALPALSALRRLAGRVHTRATSVWLTEIAARMPESTAQRLEELLTVSPEATESAFAKLCRPPKRASRNNLVEVLEHLGWLNTLRLPEGLLATLPPNRIDAWAEEARRLTATGLREYVAPRRHALLACLLVRTRASRLDDLVTILVRFIRRIEARARADLEAWHNQRRMNVTMLVNVLRDLAIVRRAGTHEANKAEHYHDFAAHLNFGSHGVLRTNSRVEQEKAVIANQLVANAVILQTVADQTRIIEDLKREGYPFNICDAKHLSPYLTRQILRFGKFPVRCKAEPFPDNVRLDP